MLRNAVAAASESDFSLYLYSPAFGAAVSPADDPAGIWWYLCTMDYHGNPWKFDSAGRPVAGALQDTFSGGAYVGDGNGGVSVTGGTVGYNDLVTGASLTVKIKFDSGRLGSPSDTNGSWETVSVLTATVKRSWYLPIIPRRSDHFRLRFEGSGEWRLYSLVRENYSGSEI